MRYSRHVMQTDPPALTKLMDRTRRLAAAGPVINLAQAVVDFTPPEKFLRAVAAALNDTSVHRYTPDPGLLELRRILAGHLERYFGLSPDPERELMVTPGANQACFSALVTMLEPGSEVIIPAPWYFNHAMTVRMLGCTVRAVRTEPGEGHVPDLESIRRALTPATRVLILVSPNNPTGAVYPDGWIRQLAALLSGREVWVLSDQTYQTMVFDRTAPLSIGSLPEMHRWTATAGSFSKSMALAGWRIGFLTGPADFIEQVIKVHDSSVISASHITQRGLAAALPEMDQYLETIMPVLESRRDALVSSLATGEGLIAETPGGSPFVFVHLPAGVDDLEFAARLLEEERLAVLPGSVLGPGGHGALRLSFAATPEVELAEAGTRLRRLAVSIGKKPTSESRLGQQ